MSDEALAEYKKARDSQLTRNDALRIRTKVKEARDNSHLAARRWPFELIQNAHDPGPRAGRDKVNVTLLWDEISATFSHDGAPFSVQELAALLSGGSSKDFESEETTGRFGTGFLVTHVLATKARVSGFLNTSHGPEQFALKLDREGDENHICENIDQCNDAIGSAKPLTSPSVDSAEFAYETPDPEALALGVDTLRAALPYLFATCDHLGQVKLGPRAGPQETWFKESDESFEFADCAGIRKRVVHHCQGSAPIQYLCLRVAGPRAHSALLFVLKAHDGYWSVCRPADDFPRVFWRFPIRPSHHLRTTVVIDGPFDVSQERNRVPLTQKNKELFESALDIMPALVTYAAHEGWDGAHWLAKMGPVLPSDSTDTEDAQWLTALLSRTTKELAMLPLVRTQIGLLPADPTLRPRATAVLAKYAASSKGEDIPFETIFALVGETTIFHPAIPDLARDWQVIFSGWAELGTPLDQVTLESLVLAVGKKAMALSNLPVRENKLQWLARLIDAVGESWEVRKGVDKGILRGMLPDQTGVLDSPEALWRDPGISESLKDISESLGINIRNQLLDLTLVREAGDLALPHFNAALEASLRGSLSEDELINQCLNRLQKDYTENLEVTTADDSALVGSVRLLAYLHARPRPAAATVAQQFPILASDSRIVHWTRHRMLIAPVCKWHEAARPFQDVYPANRMLAELYAGDPAKKIPDVVSFLVDWEMAIPDPLHTESPKELKDKRLAALAEVGQDTEGIVVSGETFSQVSFLHLDLLNRCQEDPRLARSLLGLILCYIAQNDTSWREVREVVGKRGGLPVTLRLRGALWLADLRHRAWVPTPTDDGKIEKHLATASSLRHLLDDSSWLASNELGITLLSEFFGFDALEIRLLGLEPSLANDLRLRLSQLIQTLGTIPSDYEKLIIELKNKEKRREQVESCRKFGLAVQAAVAECLASIEGITEVRLVDRGYDYAVYLETGDISDFVAHFEFGPYFVEVKATTDGVVRLTSTQAAVASENPERFVLCVVDLRSVPSSRLGEEWTAKDVAPLARFVIGIGGKVAGTTVLVESARVTEVPIRNESALRYAVAPELWETHGVSVSEWVSHIVSLDPRS